MIPLVPNRPLVIGTHDTADLKLRDSYVSSRHARIRACEGGYLIEDLGSTNGTYLNGLRVSRAWLNAGTHISLGNWRARVTQRPLSLRSGERSEQTRILDSARDLGLVGSSSAFREMVRTIERLAPLARPVLLTGETGTGKELAARALHRLSPRANGPFVALNCGAIPDGLSESELFGHVRGAFTGAHRDHAGAFARARGGTLFLDEIAELPRALQAKLLRVLEVGRVSPVGAERDHEIDVRVLSATHQPIRRLVTEGRFREDLFHRLGVLGLPIPPLRARCGDVRELLMSFAAVVGNELGRPVELEADALAAAAAYPWPGNIRELRNALFRAAAMAEGPITRRELLPRRDSDRAEGDATTVTIPRGTFAEMKRALLRYFLVEHGSIRKASRALKVPRSTLGSWLKK